MLTRAIRGRNRRHSLSSIEWRRGPGSTAIELNELLRTWSAEFIPLPAHLRVPWRSGLKSALLNSTAVPPTPPRRGTGHDALLPSWEGSGWVALRQAHGEPPLRVASQVSLNPAAIGKRAARIAGNSPPSNPMVADNRMALRSSFGVTAKANAIWLQVWKFMVAAPYPSKAR